MNESYAERYSVLEHDHYWFQARRLLVKTMVDIYSLPGGERRRLLDIGCGSGTFLQLFDELFECTGIEPNATLAQQARSTGSKVLEAHLPDDFDELPVQIFNVVLMLDVLEHIEDDVGTLRLIRRVIDDQGRLFINVPASPLLWSHHDITNEHYRRYTLALLRSVLKSAGFQVEFISYWNFLLWPGALIARRWWPRISGHENNLEVPNHLLNSILARFLYIDWLLARALKPRWGTSIFAVARL